MFIRTYLERTRAALASGVNRPPVPMARRSVWVYLGTAAYLLFWLAAGFLIHKRKLFFLEGGPVDWLSTVYLATTACLAWSAWSVGPRNRETGSWFWLAGSMGFLFFTLDERFQFHEEILERWVERLGPSPLEGVSWNDILVATYGLFALILLAFALPAFVRYRGVLRFFVAGFVFYVLHTLTDMTVPDSRTKDYWEESFKLFSGASLMLGFLQAVLCRAAEPATSRRAGVGWRHGVVFLAITLLAAGILQGGELEWRRALLNYWGDPTAWLASVYLGAGTLMVALTVLPAGSRPRAERGFWRAAAVLFGVLALDQAVIACAHRFSSRRITELFSRPADELAGILQHPVRAQALVGLALFAGLVVVGRRIVWRRPDSGIYLFVGTGLLLLLVPLSLALAESAGRFSVTVSLLGCASLLLACWSRFISPFGEPPRSTGKEPIH